MMIMIFFRGVVVIIAMSRLLWDECSGEMRSPGTISSDETWFQVPALRAKMLFMAGRRMLRSMVREIERGLSLPTHHVCLRRTTSCINRVKAL